MKWTMVLLALVACTGDTARIKHEDKDGVVEQAQEDVETGKPSWMPEMDDEDPWVLRMPEMPVFKKKVLQDFVNTTQNHMMLQDISNAMQNNKNAIQRWIANRLNGLKEVLGNIDDQIKGWIEKRSNWVENLVFSGLELSHRTVLGRMQNKSKSVVVTVVSTQILNLVKQMSYSEKVSLLLKTFRTVFTWVLAQESRAQRKASLELLMRYYFARDKDGVVNEARLFSGSEEKAAMLHAVDDDLKGRGAALMDTIVPRLTELAADELRETEGSIFGKLADKLPSLRENFKVAKGLLARAGVEERVANTAPDVVFLTEVTRAAIMVTKVQKSLEEVEVLAFQQLGKVAEHFPAGSLMQSLAASLQDEMPQSKSG